MSQWCELPYLTYGWLWSARYGPWACRPREPERPGGYSWWRRWWPVGARPPTVVRTWPAGAVPQLRQVQVRRRHQHHHSCLPDTAEHSLVHRRSASFSEQHDVHDYYVNGTEHNRNHDHVQRAQRPRARRRDARRPRPRWQRQAAQPRSRPLPQQQHELDAEKNDFHDHDVNGKQHHYDHDHVCNSNKHNDHELDDTTTSSSSTMTTTTSSTTTRSSANTTSSTSTEQHDALDHEVNGKQQKPRPLPRPQQQRAQRMVVQVHDFRPLFVDDDDLAGISAVSIGWNAIANILTRIQLGHF